MDFLYRTATLIFTQGNTFETACQNVGHICSCLPVLNVKIVSGQESGAYHIPVSKPPAIFVQKFQVPNQG